jgi:hypothetical protein
MCRQIKTDKKGWWLTPVQQRARQVIFTGPTPLFIVAVWRRSEKGGRIRLEFIIM